MGVIIPRELWIQFLELSVAAREGRFVRQPASFITRSVMATESYAQTYV